MNKSAELPKFDSEAHRGGRGLMPENTIPAMINAINLGVSTLEADLHVTADDQVILSHDSHVNPIFSLNAKGEEFNEDDAIKQIFYQKNYAEVRKFDVGSKYYPAFPQQKKQKAEIPLLADMIDSVQNYLKVTGKAQVFYNLETKSGPKGDNTLHPDPDKFIKLVMDVIEQKNIKPWVIIQSFDPRTLEVLHKKYPEVKTSFLTSEGPLEENLKKLSFTPTIFSPNYKLVSSALVQQCHEKRMKVIPWTVNSIAEIRSLILMKVDGIITDYPELFNLP